MAALIRLMVVGFVVLTIIYVGLLFYARSVQRSKLIQTWEEEGRAGDREAFVREGMDDYEGSLQRKLLLGVYVVPVLSVAAIIYLTNFN